MAGARLVEWSGRCFAHRRAPHSLDRVLALLLERPGEVVTREELRFGMPWAVRALVAQERGHRDGAVEHARLALDAAGLRHSNFRYHANLELVDKLDSKLHEVILRLAGTASRKPYAVPAAV